MPTYGYECLGCANSFETFQKITDDALTECGSCGGVLKKKIFPVGIVFKGSGFYVNDYAKKSGAAEETAPTKVETPAANATPEAAATTDSAPQAAKAAEATSVETKPVAAPGPATPSANPAG
jgi:putative FmdB family regulatory protein